MKKLLFVVGFMLFVQLAWSQKFSIKGQLKDSISGPLPSATILLLSAADSSLINFSASNPEGLFELKNIARGDYLLKITFVGYAPYIQKVIPPTEGLLDVGIITMKPFVQQLDGVVVQGERAPVTIKKDTIEFNAGSFKTKQNATVEDLLKKLPGVEVENDGTITSQGERVQRVTVDGKNFFGRDPKIATRNLPADAIDKVQILDRKSEQAEFSGIDDGQREKTINLELKEEKRNGAFGTLMAGAGLDDRHQGRVSLNRFKKGQQLSVLGMGNNVNEQGFSIDDYMNFTGGMQQMMGGGGVVRLEFNANNSQGIPLNFGGRPNGFMSTYAGGLNFNNTIGKNTEANGSYFYNYLDQTIDRDLDRLNFLPSGNISFRQNSKQNSTNHNHRANTTIDHKIDSANSLRLTANVGYSQTDLDVSSSSETRNSLGELQNEGDRISVSESDNISFNANLMYRHKFGKKGRTLTTSAALTLADIQSDGLLDATTTFYDENGVTVDNVQQSNTQKNTNKGYGTSFTYTEPLGGRKYLELTYNFMKNLNDVNREVFDRVNEQLVFNEELSNEFTSDYTYHRPGLNIRINRKKYNLTVGASVQHTNLSGELPLLDATIDRTFENVLPAVRFNYSFASTRNLRLDYETSVQEPSIQQLQPVINNNDPLNIYEGNPQLRPAYTHRWRASFNAFDPATFLSFFSSVDINYTSNAIINSQRIDDQLVRITKPVNVDNSTTLSSNLSLGLPVRKINSRFNIGVNARSQKSINVLNEVNSEINQRVLGGNFRYNYTYKEIVDLSLSANVSRQETTYDFNEQANQVFFNKTFTSELNINFLKNLQFNTAFDYLIFDAQQSSQSQTIPLLNMAISWFVLKAKSGELKFAVSNALDQNLGVNQRADVNYFEREVINSLGRYFMLSFTYALNKQLNPMGVRGGGRSFRFIQQ